MEVNFFPVFIIKLVILKTVTPEDLSFLSITFIQKNEVSIFWYFWNFSCKIQVLNDTVINIKVQKTRLIQPSKSLLLLTIIFWGDDQAFSRVTPWGITALITGSKQNFHPTPEL